MRCTVPAGTISRFSLLDGRCEVAVLVGVEFWLALEEAMVAALGILDEVAESSVLEY